MEATLDAKDGFYFWETPDHLGTEKGEIGIFCDAPETGPTDEQVLLWKFIYENVEFFQKSAESLLRDRLDDFSCNHRYHELIWCSVLLSRDGERSSLWEISFELPEVAIFDVSFVHGEPTIVNANA